MCFRFNGAKFKTSATIKYGDDRLNPKPTWLSNAQHDDSNTFLRNTEFWWLFSVKKSSCSPQKLSRTTFSEHSKQTGFFPFAVIKGIFGVLLSSHHRVAHTSSYETSKVPHMFLMRIQYHKYVWISNANILLSFMRCYQQSKRYPGNSKNNVTSEFETADVLSGDKHFHCNQYETSKVTFKLCDFHILHSYFTITILAIGNSFS